MKADNITSSVVQREDVSNSMITKVDLKGMSQGKLLELLRKYESNGRTLRFQEEAVSQEKKEKGIPYLYDFSWSWLTEQAKEKGIVYGEDGHWNIVEQADAITKDVIIVRNVESKKKRTVEAAEEAFKAFDRLADRLAIQKALLMTEAIQHFVKEVETGRISFEYRLR